LHDETGLVTKRKMCDYLNVKLNENLEKRVPGGGREREKIFTSPGGLVRPLWIFW